MIYREGCNIVKYTIGSQNKFAWYFKLKKYFPVFLMHILLQIIFVAMISFFFTCHYVFTLFCLVVGDCKSYLTP